MIGDSGFNNRDLVIDLFVLDVTKKFLVLESNFG